MSPDLPVDLDDDDDLIIVPAAKPAAPPIDLDDDEDDLLLPGALKLTTVGAAPPPPPPPPPPVDDLLEDEEDLDIPTPPKAPAAATTSHPAPPAAAPTPAPPAASAPAPPPAPVAVKVPVSAASPGTASPKASGASMVETHRRKSVVAHVPNSCVLIEGWLEKQNPSWPHAFKRRYCIVSGCTLAYYDCPPQVGQDPLGHFPLQGANITLDIDKKPFSFGISGPNLTHKDMRGRMYVFAATNKAELNQWLEGIQMAAGNAIGNELHWFEKLVEGLY